MVEILFCTFEDSARLQNSYKYVPHENRYGYSNWDYCTLRFTKWKKVKGEVESNLKFEVKIKNHCIVKKKFQEWVIACLPWVPLKGHWLESRSRRTKTNIGSHCFSAKHYSVQGIEWHLVGPESEGIQVGWHAHLWFVASMS